MSSDYGSRLQVWGVSLPADAISTEERQYLATLPAHLPTHAWVCAELDRVWHAFELDNRRPLAEQRVGEFYRHPVWLMNGIFSASDPMSRGHRRAIASYIEKLAPCSVADFGGGFGELARQIAEASPATSMAVIEPFPAAVGRERLHDLPQVRFEPCLADGKYDVVVAQDVLEHVEDPVFLASDLARSVRPGGCVVFANNFTPVIACHLPSTFHLRHTFPLVMRAMGLAYVGRIDGASHAQVFRVRNGLRVDRARRAERLSRSLEPLTTRLGRASAALRRSVARLRRRSDRPG